MTASTGQHIIVTGGAGFIGSNVVRALNAVGETHITIVDHLTDTGKWTHLLDLKFSDYYDRADFLTAIKRGEVADADLLIHMGACTDTTVRDEGYLLYNNTLYSKQLLSWCIDHDVRFIFATSGATYGDGSRGY